MREEACDESGVWVIGMARHQFSNASIMDLPAFRVIGFEGNCTGEELTAVVLQCSLETCVDTSAPSIANMSIFGYLFVSNERPCLYISHDYILNTLFESTFPSYRVRWGNMWTWNTRRRCAAEIGVTWHILFLWRPFHRTWFSFLLIVARSFYIFRNGFQWKQCCTTVVDNCPSNNLELN